MKQIFLATVLLTTLQPIATAAPAAVPKTKFGVAVALITGAASVFSAANSVEATTIYTQKQDVVHDLKQRNLSPSDSAIFQLYFAVDPNAAHRWFLSPNIYALVQLEGQGDFIPASIAKGYTGQQLSLTIHAREVRAGGRILVHILDDKEFWNTTGNTLLQTEVPVKIAGTQVTPMIQTHYEVGAKLRLLNKDITFQPPGEVAIADITVPESSDGIWLATGTLYDTDKHRVGQLQFRQVWRSDPSLLPEMSGLAWKIVFWGGLAVVLGAIFVSQLRAGHAKA